MPILYAWYEHSIKKEVMGHPVPQHIAIIQDGNRRYARKLGKSTEQGHTDGADTAQNVLGWCEEFGIKELTLYGFSTENFKRSEQEKKAIFGLIRDKLRSIRENKKTHESKLRMRMVGDITLLPEDLKEEIQLTDAATASYDNFYMNLAVAYGGRKEIVDCARKIAKEVKSGALSPERVTEGMVDKYLYLGSETPPRVDLIIRTGWEWRTSNFLPWQASGNECAIYISASYWPEFRKIDFIRAIRAYQIREREHRVKTAVRMLKIKRQSAGFDEPGFKDSLISSLNISGDEADVILRHPLVKKELTRMS